MPPNQHLGRPTALANYRARGLFRSWLARTVYIHATEQSEKGLLGLFPNVIRRQSLEGNVRL